MRSFRFASPALRRRSHRFRLRRIAGAGGRRRAPDRDRIVSEPGLLVLPARQREPDPILPAVRRARAQFRRRLTGIGSAGRILSPRRNTPSGNMIIRPRCMAPASTRRRSWSMAAPKASATKSPRWRRWRAKPIAAPPGRRSSSRAARSSSAPGGARPRGGRVARALRSAGRRRGGRTRRERGADARAQEHSASHGAAGPLDRRGRAAAAAVERRIGASGARAERRNRTDPSRGEGVIPSPALAGEGGAKRRMRAFERAKRPRPSPQPSPARAGEGVWSAAPFSAPRSTPSESEAS